MIEFYKDGKEFEVTRITFHGDGVGVTAEHRRNINTWNEPKVFEVSRISAMEPTLEEAIKVLQSDATRGIQ